MPFQRRGRMLTLVYAANRKYQPAEAIPAVSQDSLLSGSAQGITSRWDPSLCYVIRWRTNPDYRSP